MPAPGHRGVVGGGDQRGRGRAGDQRGEGDRGRARGSGRSKELLQAVAGEVGLGDEAARAAAVDERAEVATSPGWRQDHDRGGRRAR